LQVSHNLLQSLPAIGTLVRLNILDVSFNALTVLPSINTLSSLERLYASDNMLDTLPQMHLLTTLKRFDVSNNLLRTLPDLSKNPQLGELVADNNLLTVAPYLGSLSMLKKIQLQDNRLTFDDLAQYIGRADSAYLDYSPQKNTGTLRNVDVKPDEPITLVPSIGDTLKGIVYAWYRNGSLLAKSTSKLYTINATQPADSGKYHCKLTHPRFPTLTLVCDTLRLRVSNSEPETTCPKLKQAVVDITSPECTEVGTLRLSFAPGLLDSISLALYDSTQSLIPGVSKTFYDHIKQGEYHLLMRPTDPTCAFAFDQKIVVKARKCYEVVLTPNNDGKDDILYFNQKGTATIYDKNGKFIKTLQIPTEWDGSHSEGLLPQGYYYVKINDGRESFNLSIIY
ncbi:MAG TPA: hypothetical protein VL947_09070, partial [Cytophagales bacterium]|nr:hypothetical protein [Cytophagales bacterium]